MAQDDTRAQLLKLVALLYTEDPCLCEMPAYPRVRIDNLRWSESLWQSLFDMVGVDNSEVLYAEGVIEGIGPNTYQVFLRENPQRPDKESRPFGWVSVISFSAERAMLVSRLFDALIESALRLGLILEIGEAADG